MIEKSKSSKIVLIAVLTVSTIFVASIAALSQTARHATPIKGIGVVIKKKPADGLRRAESDAEGNFTVGGLAAGLYDIWLECKSCEGLDIGEAGVQLRITGATESGDLKRTLSKRQLVSGVAIPIEIAGKGDRLLSGHVSLLK